MKISYCIFIVSVWASCRLYAQTPIDTSYTWIKPALNFVQFYDKKALEHFYKSWQQVSQQKLSVVLLGDSHLQNGTYPDELRRRLHQALGDGGKGLMFAYSAANSYSVADYRTSHTGKWIFAKSFMGNLKLPLGVAGMAIRTESPASTLKFTPKDHVPSSYNTLKIYLKQDTTSFDFKILVAGQIVPVRIEKENPKPFLLIKIPPVEGTIEILLEKNNPYQKSFEFYGMSLETDTNRGAILHNGGVGAAQYKSVLRQQLFSTQLPCFQPDVVVIDFGTNDYLMRDRIEPDLEKEIKKVIAKVREAAPEASIILTTAQDLYWRKVNIKSGSLFQEIIHKVAQEMQCGVYDWYWVAGGQGVMRDWVRAKIAQTDMIHLNTAGYRLKGDLFFDAMQNTIQWIDKNPSENKLLMFTDSLKAHQAHLLRQRLYAYGYNAYTAKPKKKAPPTKTLAMAVTSKVASKKTMKQHTIVSGDTLYDLGRRYGASVSELIQWNNLKSNNLRLGSVLIVGK